MTVESSEPDAVMPAITAPRMAPRMKPGTAEANAATAIGNATPAKSFVIAFQPKPIASVA